MESLTDRMSSSAARAECASRKDEEGGWREMGWRIAEEGKVKGAEVEFLLESSLSVLSVPNPSLRRLLRA